MEEGEGGFITEEVEFKKFQKAQPQSQGWVDQPHRSSSLYDAAGCLPYQQIDESRRPVDSAGCGGCSSLSYSQDLFAAFGVYLCRECRKSENLVSKV